MLTPEEYRQEWLKGLYHTDYNNCRFAEDKIQFARDWIFNINPSVDIDNPKNIIDRINYLKIYDKDPRKQIWADKISCLDELKKMNLEELILPTYLTKHGNLTLEEYNSLPNENLIFKCNHGSGWNMKFNKTETADPTYLFNKLDEWLFLNYAYIGGYEWQYENITPGILVQPDLGELMDYQFWCENGEIQAIQLTKKLGKNLEEFLAFTDPNGDYIDWCIGIKPMLNTLSPSYKLIVDKMRPYVLKLAKDFKFVRVDLYHINKQVKFGELTFSPCSGKLYITRL